MNPALTVTILGSNKCGVQVLRFVLPLPLVPLVVLSSRKSVMGDFVMGKSGGVCSGRSDGPDRAAERRPD